LSNKKKKRTDKRTNPPQQKKKKSVCVGVNGGKTAGGCPEKANVPKKNNPEKKPRKKGPQGVGPKLGGGGTHSLKTRVWGGKKRERVVCAGGETRHAEEGVKKGREAREIYFGGTIRTGE